MKPTSIIFLCLAVLLIVGGIVTCFIAIDKAKDEDVVLFETADTKNEIIILDESELNKISLILKDADINIYGGAENSYIEIKNYKSGSYSYDISGGILTLDETFSFLRFFSLGEGKAKFGGLRQYLIHKEPETVDKSIDLHLSNDYKIKHFDIKLDRGNVNVENIKIRSDFFIKIGTGNLVFEGNRSNSAIVANIGTGDAVIRDSVLTSVEAEVNRGNFNFFIYNYEYQHYEVTTKSGFIYVEGVNKGTIMSESTPMALIKINALINTGDAFIGAFESDLLKSDDDNSTENIK